MVVVEAEGGEVEVEVAGDGAAPMETDEALVPGSALPAPKKLTKGMDVEYASEVDGEAGSYYRATVLKKFPKSALVRLEQLVDEKGAAPQQDDSRRRSRSSSGRHAASEHASVAIGVARRQEGRGARRPAHPPADAPAVAGRLPRRRGGGDAPRARVSRRMVGRGAHEGALRADS